MLNYYAQQNRTYSWGEINFYGDYFKTDKNTSGRAILYKIYIVLSVMYSRYDIMEVCIPWHLYAKGLLMHQVSIGSWYLLSLDFRLGYRNQCLISLRHIPDVI